MHSPSLKMLTSLLLMLISIETVSSFTLVTRQTHMSQMIGTPRINTFGAFDFTSPTMPAITSLNSQTDEEGLSNEEPSSNLLHERFGKELEKGKEVLERGKEVIEQGKGAIEKGKEFGEQVKGAIEKGKEAIDQEGKEAIEKGQDVIEKGKGAFEKGKGALKKGREVLKKGKGALKKGKGVVVNVVNVVNVFNNTLIDKNDTVVQKIRDRVKHFDLDQFSFGKELNDLGKSLAGQKLNVTQIMDQTIGLTSFGIKATQNFLEARGISKFLKVFRSNEKICTRLFQLLFVTIVLPIFKPATYIKGFQIVRAAFESISNWVSCDEQIPSRLIEAILFITSAWCILGERFRAIVSMTTVLPSQIPTMTMVKEFVSYESSLSLLSKWKTFDVTALLYGMKTIFLDLHEIIINLNPRKIILVNLLVILTLRTMAESMNEIRSDEGKESAF